MMYDPTSAELQRRDLRDAIRNELEIVLDVREAANLVILDYSDFVGENVIAGIVARTNVVKGFNNPGFDFIFDDTIMIPGFSNRKFRVEVKTCGEYVPYQLSHIQENLAETLVLYNTGDTDVVYYGKAIPAGHVYVCPVPWLIRQRQYRIWKSHCMTQG